MLASPVEVTAVNGGYYRKILAISFLFLFFLLQTAKKFFKEKNVFSC